MIRIFPVCLSDKQFVNSSPEDRHVISGTEMRKALEILENLLNVGFSFFFCFQRFWIRNI